MLKKIRQRTLEKAIDHVLNISVGIMGFGAVGLFLQKEEMTRIDASIILSVGVSLFMIALYIDHRFID